MSDSLIIIPTYNEILNIEAIIEKTFFLKISFDILIVDDGSPDGTGIKVKKLQEKYNNRLHILEREGKQGLGTAYIAGFNWALEKDYQFVFEMDADFSHNPNDLLNLYDACANKGADVAIGSRYISGVNVVNWPIGRVIMSYYASAYVRLITGMKIMDTTAGFKCYRKEVLETIDFDKIKFKGYAFQIEMKFTACKYKFKIVEVPIIFTDRKEGNSKMSGGIFNEALWGVIIMKWKSLFRKYNRKQ